mgnify:CR=1 FL=1
MRELFIYWRTADSAAASDAVARWQTELRQSHPQLDAALYLRADDAGSAPSGTTLMEVYRGDGLDALLESRLREEGDRRLAAWVDGQRKVEVFIRQRVG